MSRNMLILLLFIGVALIFVGMMNLLYTPPSYQQYGWQQPGNMYPNDFETSPSSPSNSDIINEFDSNGEMIYYTGFNEDGQRIPFQGGPRWLSVHGGSCVSCHGVDGKGGVPIMMGTVVPPDITYEALTAEVHHEDEHEVHPVYTDETIKTAIKQGIDPSGERLDYTMPRWGMSEEDLNDLIEYLKTL